jgi:hypothetical protein
VAHRVSSSGGRLLRRHTTASTTASVGRRGREATGAELLFLRSCEGEAANMQASTGAGKVRGIATPLPNKLLHFFELKSS